MIISPSLSRISTKYELCQLLTNAVQNLDFFMHLGLKGKCSNSNQSWIFHFRVIQALKEGLVGSLSCLLAQIFLIDGFHCDCLGDAVGCRAFGGLGSPTLFLIGFLDH